MPLIECPDCLNQISAATPACPHCGHPFEPLPAPAKARPLPQSPPPAIPHPLPQTVYVKDTALTRNRGCGDLLLYGFLAVVLVIVGGCVIAVM
jgi:hypothetical protein